MPAVETSTGVSSGTADLTDSARRAEDTEPAGPAGPRRRRQYLREPVPWRRTDVTRALVLLVIGLAVGVWGWIGVSGEVRLREQEGWMVLACLGAVIAACGGVYLLTVASREVRLGQRQLMFDLADVMGWSVTVTKRGRLRLERSDDAVASGATVSTWVSGPGMTLVHHSECPIARGKDVSEISAADAAARNLGACGVCASERSEGEVNTG